MSESIIQFESVSKSYPLYDQVRGVKHLLFNFPHNFKTLRQIRYEALRGISFEVRRGEQFGVIGHNGAGKSTTLGLIAGVIKPTTGRVIVRGRVSPLLSLGAGFHTDLSGRENILLNGILMGLTRREVQARMAEIVEFSGLGEFVDRPIRVYSSGMLARLGFSVVAHLDPEILLIDEVLSVGDIRFRQKCIAKIREFKRTGVTMVLVSHSVHLVAKLCNRAMWIENQTIRKIGKARVVVDAYCNAANLEPLVSVDDSYMADL
ncbi:ABC transporter ATP-binding protein [Leptolyngbya sp. AN02str]|uniref:ABC transporter ATP-binding protein n=1 Tax=Leptolyngbya sp. AN02str TaxID=3423363 RepID=UPI003D31E327